MFDLKPTCTAQSQIFDAIISRRRSRQRSVAEKGGIGMGGSDSITETKMDSSRISLTGLTSRRVQAETTCVSGSFARG
jgi:hypothetical protein